MSKILYLTTGCFDKGGISRYNRYQIRALRELQGNEKVRIYSLLGPAEGDFEDEFEVTWHGWGASSLSKLAYSLKVIKEIILWKPDIVWIGHVNLTDILIKFGLMKKAKTVLNIYGLEVWSGLRPDVEKGFKQVSYVISDCYFTAKYAEDEGLRKNGTVEVIWDCVDLEKFKPADNSAKDLFFENYQLPDPSIYPWILSLGRLSHSAAHKGYERLLEVFSNVVLENDEAVLVFAGKGDMVEKLKQIAVDLNVQHRVFFSGMVHEDDMPKFYRASRVFSLVSDRGVGRGEGIPLTPLEAMACGSPIIVGNQDGSQEAIFNNSNGYCISPFDLKSHKNAILSLLDNEKEFDSKSASALALTRKHFSYEHFKQKHLQFLKTIG